MADPIKLNYRTPQPHAVRRALRLKAAGTLSTMRSLASLAYWLLFSVGALGVGGWTVGYFLFPPIAVPVVLFVLALIPSIAVAVKHIRTRRVAAILGYLHQAVRLNLPMDRILMAAARSEQGKLQDRLINLRACLEQGIQLWAALAAAVPEAPPRIVELIKYAEQAGQLPRTLHRLVEQDLGEKRGMRRDGVLMLWYPPLLLLVVAAVVGELNVFVMPKFIWIFKDAHASLPPISRALLLLGDEGMLVLAAAFALVICFVFSLRLRETLRIRRRAPLAPRLRDRIVWNVPLYGSIVRNRGMADLCTVLADATQLGYPLPRSVERAGALDLNRVLQVRVRAWHQRLAAGMLPAEAAREAGLPRFLVGMLASARGGEDLADIFRFAARFYRERFVIRREVLAGAYVPAVTLAMGVVVAGVMLSVFAPLVQLISLYGTHQPGGF